MPLPRILATVTLALAACVAAHAQQPPSAKPRVTELTALDYIEIEQLNNKYAWAIDTCSNDGFDYADLYTADGVFISGDSGKRWVGREQLAEAAGGNGRGCPFVKMPLTHLILSLVIEPTADGAKGKSYLIYPGKNGKYEDEQHHGQDGGYEDTYVKTPNGWRFKQRVHVYPPQIPGSYSGKPNSELPPQPAAAPASAPAR
jgi:hypothetical protein